MNASSKRIRNAVRSALREFEAFATTRVRVGGGNLDRSTGNVVTALFTHDTSRALDPHLHTHCIVFNATFDPVEQRWKALQNYELLRARKFAENVYYHELARQLRGFGYQIRNQARGDFRIEGVSESICERFSKRDAQIDEALAALLADKPELAGANLKELRAKLAVKTRARKQKDLSRAELRTLWDAQLSEAERGSLRQLTNRSAKVAIANERIALGEAVQWAEDHLFDRNSVVLECQLWQQALERARGENFTLAELKEFTRQRNYIRNPERPNEVTLRDVLLREMEIVQCVKDGTGTCGPLVETPPWRIRNWMMNSTKPWLPCSVQPMRCRFSGAVPALAKVLSCVNWLNRSGKPAEPWSSSRRNASRSWKWKARDSRHQRRSPIFCSRVNWLPARSWSWMRPVKLAVARCTSCCGWRVNVMRG